MACPPLCTCCTDTRYHRHAGRCTSQRTALLYIRYIRETAAHDAPGCSADHAGPCKGSASRWSAPIPLHLHPLRSLASADTLSAVQPNGLASCCPPSPDSGQGFTVWHWVSSQGGAARNFWRLCRWFLFGLSPDS